MTQSNDMHFDAVYVIESLRDTDRKTGEELYDEVIGPAGFQHDRLITELVQPRDRTEFFAAFQSFVTKAIQNDRWPLLHIEAHANQQGLELASREFVQWDELKGFLQVLNYATHFNLFVTVAACSGGYLASTISLVDRAPVWAVVGPSEKLGDDQVLEAFRVFYSRLLSSLDGNVAMAALREVEARQGTKFIFLPAETMFRWAYRKYVREDCTEAELRVREANILSIARRMGLPQAVDDHSALQQIRAELTNHRAFFEVFRRRFFMTDVYPEIAHRFSVRFEDVWENGRSA